MSGKWRRAPSAFLAVDVSKKALSKKGIVVEKFQAADIFAKY